jgi:hypothetical protein
MNPYEPEKIAKRLTTICTSKNNKKYPSARNPISQACRLTQKPGFSPKSLVERHRSRYKNPVSLVSSAQVPIAWKLIIKKVNDCSLFRFF